MNLDYQLMSPTLSIHLMHFLLCLVVKSGVVFFNYKVIIMQSESCTSIIIILLQAELNSKLWQQILHLVVNLPKAISILTQEKIISCRQAK